MNLYLESLRWFTGSVKREEQASLMFYQVAHSAHHFLFLSHWSCFQLTPYMSLQSYYQPARWQHLWVKCRRGVAHVEQLILAAPTSSIACASLFFLIFWVGTQREALPPSRDVCAWDKTEDAPPPPPPLDAEVNHAINTNSYHYSEIPRLLSVKSWMCGLEMLWWQWIGWIWAQNVPPLELFFYFCAFSET